jgi:two-component system, chemotaxis family, CheB/CheR fusion protein
LHVSRLDFRRVVQEVAEGVTPQASAKHQLIAVDVPNHPVLVDGDWIRLQQVVSNLALNAITYTGNSGFLYFAIEQRDAEVVLTVRDTGQGIPSVLLPHVFEPFVRGRDGSAHSLGVGLAIARELVELHNGAIRAESAVVGAAAPSS